MNETDQASNDSVVEVLKAKTNAASAVAEPRSLMTTRDVAELLRIDPYTVRRWAQHGTLPCLRLGERVIRFDPDAVKGWIQRHA
jgi:excisionase family DNA binding protein